jgi:membrane dipeptidase
MNARPSSALLPAALLVLGACASSSKTRYEVGTGAPVVSAVMDREGISPRAMKLFREAIVVDTHDDMPTKMLDEGYVPDVRHPAGFQSPGEGHTDLPRLIAGGITAEFLSAWVDAPYARTTPDSSFERAVRYTDSIHAFVARHPDKLIAATTAADVVRAKREGKVAIFIGVEGGHAIESSLDNLRELHRRGARYLTLTWNNGNSWAGSSIGVNGTRTGGLTPFGKEVVLEMNRLGMFVDISHVSDSTFWDAVNTSTMPVIASHSSARALNEHPRNLSDDQLRAVAKSGGVVNVNFFSRFLDPRYRVAIEAMEKQLAADRARLASTGVAAAIVDSGVARRRRTLSAALPTTPLSVLIDHFDHIAKVAGVDHVGIGSDFDGVSALPQDMADVTDLPRIAQALLDRGYTEPDVKKILGGNMVRVMEKVLK